MLRQTKIESGWIRGLPSPDPRVTSYKGIPYAKPPVGELRWKPPQPADKWDGIRDCFEYAPIAMQTMMTDAPEDNIYVREFRVDPDVPMSEDCLYLNVWTPAKAVGEKLPIYIWMHGGSLAGGYTSELQFDGERISRRGVVVITIAYRLNAFGFITHPEITAENPDAPANFGHLDQRAAIAWAKRNAEAFGGDPDNITIGGQSAGGMSVAALIASPLNHGLFHKGVIESGYWRFYYTAQRPGCYTLDDAEKAGVSFFESIGVTSLAEARAMDAATLMEYARDYPSRTVVDGLFLKDSPNDVIDRGEGLHVPILLGNTGDEFFDLPVKGRKPGETTRFARPAETAEEFEDCIKSVFGDKANAFMSICRKNGDSIKTMMDTAKFQTTELAAHIASKQNERLGDPYKLYYYIFKPFMPGWDNPGVFHSAELWFFFETLAKCWRPFDGRYYDLARYMCNYLANFIKTGDPNGPDADGTPMPKWTELTPATPYPMVFTEDGAFMDDNGPSDVIRFISDDYIDRQLSPAQG